MRVFSCAALRVLAAIEKQPEKDIVRHIEPTMPMADPIAEIECLAGMEQQFVNRPLTVKHVIEIVANLIDECDQFHLDSKVAWIHLVPPHEPLPIKHML
jgi:hypothetical protein